jgi:hypothetical protein
MKRKKPAISISIQINYQKNKIRMLPKTTKAEKEEKAGRKLQDI